MKRSISRFGVHALLLTWLLPASTFVHATGSRTAFEARSVQGVIHELAGSQAVQESQAIMIKAPAIAENGDTVGVRVVTKLRNVEAISLIVQGNPRPLAAIYRLAPGSVPVIKSRIRIVNLTDEPRSANVIALVRAGGKWYRATRLVKVTRGGCGTGG